MAAGLDFETSEDHTITVTATSTDGSTSTQDFTIDVTNVNEAPTNLTLSGGTVNENSFEGTVVGSMAAVDPDAGETFTYTLTDDASGRFSINSSTGEIVVADRIEGSILFDFEVNPTHDVVVLVTDSGGNTYSETITINVADILNETIVGDGDDNTLTGDGGDDTITGQAGVDAITGGAGDDDLTGGGATTGGGT